MAPSPYTQQLMAFLATIDTSLNGIPGQRIGIQNLPGASPLHGPIDYIQIVNPFTFHEQPSYLAEVARRTNPDFTRVGDLFVVWEPILLEEIKTFGQERPEINISLLLWEMAISRVWLRVQSKQLIIAACAGMQVSDQEDLYLSIDEIWEIFSEIRHGVSEEEFKKSCADKLSANNERMGSLVYNHSLKKSLECKMIASIAMRCGGKEDNLRFLKMCRSIALWKAIGPWS